MDDLPAREKWNRRYAAGGFTPFPPTPAPWLVENRALLPGGGHALDLACGDGRNSRYLAERGFSVEALDVSDVAVEALRAAARAGGLDVRARVADLEAWQPPSAGYDVIVNLNYLQRDLFGPLAAALRPGGLIFFETFSEAHVTELGNQFDPRFLLAPNELLGAFPTLLVRHYREGVAVRAGRPRGLASLVAQRPAAA
ncbi:MAG TPA: class I SAM-dependent methyltransferase [Solirubrobacteraceae bacterium]|nr:class I SAM-dependent methyltransferase [Solirubrobacteraceae bacterium]